MDPRLALTLVGISHRCAPVAVRERYVVNPADLASCLTSLLQAPGVCEAFVLSTCNRTEVLVVGERGADLAPVVRAGVFRNLGEKELYVYSDVQALIHVFRVAAGLDSVVLGESEVLAQIKRGIDAAESAKSLGPLLRPVLQHALQVGKRVRTETAVGQGTLSVARVGVDIAARVFGRFEGKSALVVGAGETGVLVARHLRDRGLSALAFANRTLERAQAVAAELGATACELEGVRALTRTVDIVVACVEGGTLPAQSFDRGAIRHRDLPLLVIDLSVPRAVDPALAHWRGVLLYDLDDLGRVVRENLHGREAHGDGTAEIVVAEMHKFLALRTYAAFSPAIAAMKERFESVREDVLDAVAGARTDSKDVQLAHELTRRLLDAALVHLKEGARRTSSEEALDREYQRFLRNL